MRVLVIAPHLDDETLGMGGTIAKHVDSGDEVSVIFVAHRKYNNEFNADSYEKEKACALAAKKVLGYKDHYFLDLSDERLDGYVQDTLIPLEEVYNQVQPEVVYSCFYEDNNQDHRAVYEAFRILIRPSAANRPKKVLMYEVPSSTEQSPPIANKVFCPNYFVDISNFIQIKKDALKCYSTELKSFPHPRSEEGIDIYSKFRGMQVGLNCVESFMLIRDTWE